MIYVLDGLNQRILVYQGSKYAHSIDISDLPQPRHMTYSNGMLGVVDNNHGLTGVYSLSGRKIALIAHPVELQEDYVSKLTEIGSDYVVWESYEGHFYLYDWEQEILIETKGNFSKISEEKSTVVTSTKANADGVEWSIDSEHTYLGVLGTQNQSLIYQQYEYVPDVDIFLLELSVRKLSQDGSETYAIVDFSDWHSTPLEPIYLATDGNVYVMDCLEEGTVISELILGTSDQSNMPNLETKAETRKLQMASENSRGASSLAAITSYTSSRQIAKSRAYVMANYRWTVLANHKTTSSADVEIPVYVTETITGGTCVGIPYCWGGYNGYEADAGKSSFHDVVSSTSFTAGNVKMVEVAGTIGLDCSGFAMSAYDFESTAKINTTAFASLGHAVSINDVKPMDFVVREGSHIVLVASVGQNGAITAYESYGTQPNAKVQLRERNLTDMLSDNEQYGLYQIRSLFCTTCNRLGYWYGTSAGHSQTCSVCEYIWPTTIAHSYSNGTCTVCGYSATARK